MPRARRRSRANASDEEDDYRGSAADAYNEFEDDEFDDDILVRAKLTGPVGPQPISDFSKAFAERPSLDASSASRIGNLSTVNRIDPFALRKLHAKLVSEYSDRVPTRLAEAFLQASSPVKKKHGVSRNASGGTDLLRQMSENLDAEKRERIAMAIARQQAQRRAYEAKEASMGLGVLLKALRWVSAAEASCALDRCRGDPDRAAQVLAENKGRTAARQEVALLKGSILTEADEGVSRVVSASSSSSAYSGGASAGVWVTRRTRRAANLPPIDRKLRLDDALKQADTMEGWSEARKKAFAQREVNPNAYYYRFNDPGEAQKNGRWTDEEEKLFFARMAECGVDGKWGVFARVIPGRVGYQCSNFYRWLLEQGRVSDDRYVFDDKGKAHMRKSDGTVRGAVGASGAVVSDSPAAAAAALAASGGGASAATNSAASDSVSAAAAPAVTAKKQPKAPAKKPKKSGTKRSSSSGAGGSSSSSKRAKGGVDEGESDEAAQLPDADNPLPGFIDPITMHEVRRPAMSPGGYVLGYETWLRVLSQEPRNTCPFTKQHLSRRQLVLLTLDNIEEHRASIRTVS